MKKFSPTGVFVYDLGSASWAGAFATVNTDAIRPNATQQERRFRAPARDALRVRSSAIAALVPTHHLYGSQPRTAIANFFVRMLGSNRRGRRLWPQTDTTDNSLRAETHPVAVIGWSRLSNRVQVLIGPGGRSCPPVVSILVSALIADNGHQPVTSDSFLLPAQIINQNINADQEDPQRQNSETPADVVAADQKNAGQDVTQKGNPAWSDLGVDHNGRC